MGNNDRKYPPEYVERCFQAWYLSGCPSIRRTLEIIPKFEDREVPVLATVEKWFAGEYGNTGWYVRRDELDARAQNQIDNVLVSKKVQMLEEQAAAFKDIRRKAADYLRDGDFDSSASAVQALIKASQEERKVRGISPILERLALLGDDEIMDEVKRLAERAESEGVLDAEEVEENEND